MKSSFFHKNGKTHLAVDHLTSSFLRKSIAPTHGVKTKTKTGVGSGFWHTAPKSGREKHPLLRSFFSLRFKGKPIRSIETSFSLGTKDKTLSIVAPDFDFDCQMKWNLFWSGFSAYFFRLKNVKKSMVSLSAKTQFHNYYKTLYH